MTKRDLKKSTDVCVACGATRDEVRKIGHCFRDSQGCAVPPSTPNSAPCPEACTCIPECFSMAEHTEASKALDDSSPDSVSLAVQRAAETARRAKWLDALPDARLPLAEVMFIGYRREAVFLAMEHAAALARREVLEEAAAKIQREEVDADCLACTDAEPCQACMQSSRIVGTLRGMADLTLTPSTEDPKVMVKRFKDTGDDSPEPPFQLPVDPRIHCCPGGPSVHLMEGRYGWCQRCGMLLVYENHQDQHEGQGGRWIYNHRGPKAPKV